MAEITAAAVGKLREMTNAGLMDCKKALTEAKGELDLAVDILRKRGIATAAKKASRQANEGLIVQYIQPGARIGVLVEVNCETDFVARNESFRAFCDEVEPQVLAKEKEIASEQVKNKPPQALAKIVEGKLEKFYQGHCLLDQGFVKKNSEITVKEHIGSIAKELGDEITVRRFVRFQVGEGQ